MSYEIESKLLFLQIIQNWKNYWSFLLLLVDRKI